MMEIKVFHFIEGLFLLHSEGVSLFVRQASYYASLNGIHSVRKATHPAVVYF
jgi:hypothetical protein